MRNRSKLVEYLTRDLRLIKLERLMESPFVVKQKIKDKTLAEALLALENRSDSQLELLFMVFVTIEIKGVAENFFANPTDEEIINEAKERWSRDYADQ